ncbi:MAG: hypothetical protein GTO46_12215 [Gemmatimonadetes bacterium]|nr:hypothetical protein [Gemmatimonadota bacterium]NIO32356.1 hypothetical protein [Gemmatimonadota bacterium]
MFGKMLQIRVIVPDEWREQKMEFAPDTTVRDVKERALPELLGRGAIDTSTYYVEYFEKEVLDESRTLADLGVPQGGVISLRPYDMDHPAPFDG